MSAAIHRPEPLLSTWSDGVLRSPRSGAVLRREGRFTLAGANERWPVLDGIPYLRADRAAPVGALLDLLEQGGHEEAIALLLEHEARESGAKLSEPARLIVSRRDTSGLRDTLRALGFAERGDAEAHRWSDPDYLAELALAEAHWPRVPRILDVGCGLGQRLPVFARRGAAITGADRSFTALWLARHWVAPFADLVCFDPAEPWPFPTGFADLVFAHGVVTPGPAGKAAAGELRRVTADAGTVLCAPFPVPGARADTDGASGEDPIAWLGDSAIYDDTELLAAMMARRAPREHGVAASPRATCVMVAAGAGARALPKPVTGLLAMPPRGTPLRRNPLYCEQPDGACVRRFPSDSYAERVTGRATYPSHVTARLWIVAGADPSDDALVRRRVWVDLPPRW